MNDLEMLDYPQALKNFIRRVVRILATFCGENNVALVLLIGSGGRGELTILKTPDGDKIFGDLEFLVVIKKNISYLSIIRCRKRITEEVVKFPMASEIFHVDFSVTDAEKLKIDTVLMWETWVNSCILQGDASLITDKYSDNTENEAIRLKDIHNILLYRHFAVFWGLRHHKSQQAKFYIVTRNSLDLLTALLYKKGIFLPSYKQRCEFLNKNAWNLLSSWNEADIIRFVDFINRCAEHKLKPRYQEFSDKDAFVSALREYLLFAEFIFLEFLKDYYDCSGEQDCLENFLEERKFFETGLESFSKAKSLIWNLLMWKGKKVVATHKLAPEHLYILLHLYLCREVDSDPRLIVPNLAVRLEHVQPSLIERAYMYCFPYARHLSKRNVET